MKASFAFSSMFLVTALLGAQEVSVQGKITVAHYTKSASGSANVVITLTPLDHDVQPLVGPAARLMQKNKQFTPHVLVVPERTSIEFPNEDPFFHDVFSIYHGKPFDLGLYESGAVKKVVFSKPGVSYIFCNIHPEMSAIVLVTGTPYFATTGHDGSFQITHVPPGRYKLDLWYEFAADSELASLSRQIEVSRSDYILDAMTLRASDITKQHVNKYGEPYLPGKSSY